jgi:nuclear pore complex protein Nup54
MNTNPHAQLIKVLSDPEIHGDERDGVVAKLNQFLAAVGTGKGYHQPLKSTQPAGLMAVGTDGTPFEFKEDNIFHRLKGVVYNRLSQHKNSEGMVSLILNVSSNDRKQMAESEQGRQKVR